MLSKIIANLNKRELFHTIESPTQVRVLAETAEMGSDGKKMMQDYFGFKDFTVPASKTAELLQKAKDLPVTKGKDADDETIKFDQEKQTQRKKSMTEAKGREKDKREVKQSDLGDATKKALKK